MARRESIVFAQVWRATGRAIGSTRLLDVRPNDRQVEIGSTFLGREYWRTPANTESKFLFLRYCFETPRLRAGRTQDRRPQRRALKRRSRGSGPSARARSAGT